MTTPTTEPTLDDLGALEARAIAELGADRWAELVAAARARYKRKAAYYRRINRVRSPLSSKHRRGSRANKHRRTTPTFASDRRRTA